jgi:hypothetical protein
VVRWADGKRRPLRGITDAAKGQAVRVVPGCRSALRSDPPSARLARIDQQVVNAYAQRPSEAYDHAQARRLKSALHLTNVIRAEARGLPRVAPETILYLYGYSAASLQTALRPSA